MRRAVPLALFAALALSGCSQIAAIAPVGGDRVAEIRFAAGDVLVQKAVDIETAPVCEMAKDLAVSCIGETLDGETITVTSTAADPTIMTITIGSTELFSGAIQDVLDAAIRPAS